MRRLFLAVFVLSACAPEIPNTPPTSVIVARFDPTASPAVVPSPNDLATDPQTGLLSVPIPKQASKADLAFYEWLDTLDGFPGAAGASTTFDAKLDPSTVSATSVRVFDLDDGNATVAATISYVDRDSETAPGEIDVAPPQGGWTRAHRYAIAVLGGASGVKGADGRPVVGSATWAFLRVANPLTTCEDLTSEDCLPTTEIIPSGIKDDQARRLADQTSSAKRLEALRRKYKPAIDHLVEGGVARDDIAILWTFKIANNPTFVFNPSATPPQVPTPTNLVYGPGGKLNIPIDPTTSAAYQEFVTEYLNELNGFPVTSPATAGIIGALDPATVTDQTVLVFDVAQGPLPGATISYSATDNRLTVRPPAGGWGRARTIGIAVLGGPDGVHGANGLGLAATDTWALARSPAPLVDCEVLSASCKSVVKAAPISDLQAIAAESLRRTFKPALDRLAARGYERRDVSGLWLFSTVDQPEVTFDLAAATPIIPFPSNQFLRTADDTSATGRLAFPVPAGPTGAIFAGLNTLDGFSTTAPIVSENDLTRAALDEGSIDSATLVGGTGFVKLGGSGSLQPRVTTCLNCASSMGGATPQPEQLQWVPQRPLEGLSRYAAYVTGDLTDTDGRSVAPAQTFALVRLKNPLVDAMGKSTLPVITDAQAQALEPYRQRFEGCLDDLEQRGIVRRKLALAFCVTTQSTTSVVQTLASGVSALPPAALPDVPTFLADVTGVVKGQMTGLGLPSTAIDRVFTGNIVLPFALNGTGGTLNPNPTLWSARKAPFVLFLPAGTPPAGGWPVALFGHGLTRRKEDVLAIANALAAGGLAALAVDVVYHGERATCVGSRAATMQASDDAACANPVSQQCDTATGRCVARDQSGTAACDPSGAGDLTCFVAGQGQCQVSGPNVGKCEGGDFLRQTDGSVAISAWNFLDLVNLFVTRDNFRHTGAIDFAQVVRVVRSMSAASLNAQLALASAAMVDGSSLHYVGQSLGTFNGAVFAAASGAATHVALNVPGSSQVDVLLTAPAFAAQRAGFLGNLALLGLTPGSAGFDQFMTLARTILDPADPQNLIYAAVNSGNASRRIYLQYIEGDQVLPNATTMLLINAANQNTSRQAQVFEFLPHLGTPAAGFFPASYPVAARHGFLLNPNGNPECNPLTATCATAVGQSKVVTFLVTGTAP